MQQRAATTAEPSKSTTPLLPFHLPIKTILFKTYGIVARSRACRQGRPACIYATAARHAHAHTRCRRLALGSSPNGIDNPLR